MTDLIDNVVNLSVENFEQEVLKAQGPVLVQFWANWSGLCGSLALESVAERSAMTVKLARADVDNDQVLARRYGVRAVPTLLIFDRGILHDTIVGRATPAEVCAKLEEFRYQANCGEKIRKMQELRAKP